MARCRTTATALIAFSYTAYHPGYRNTVTIDCAAENRIEALASAQRFVRRANRDLARARVPGRVRVPLHVNDMKQEG